MGDAGSRPTSARAGGHDLFSRSTPNLYAALTGAPPPSPVVPYEPWAACRGGCVSVRVADVVAARPPGRIKRAVVGFVRIVVIN